MALFEGVSRVEGSRGHTQLVKSGHMSPAQKWLIDPRFQDQNMSSVFRDGVLMKYEFGGLDLEDVVIPMGRVLGIGPSVKDFVTKKVVPTLTLPGMAYENNPVGVAPYNFAKDYFQADRQGGNAPSIITLDLITLPYIPSVEPSTQDGIAGVLEEEKALSVDLKMPWGAAIGAGIECGSYVKATASGRVCKWIKGTDNVADIVGQVIGSDLNFEQFGWLKWMLWNKTAMNEDSAVLNRSGSSSLPSDGGYPYNAEYAEGNNIFQQYQVEQLVNPTGQPGLHDGSGNYIGYGIRDTEYTDINLGTISSDIAENTVMAFQAKGYVGDDVQNLQEGVVVKIDGTELPASAYTINYKKGLINITVPANSDSADRTVTATFKAERYGTPTYLDFKGVIGALNILLKR